MILRQLRSRLDAEAIRGLTIYRINFEVNNLTRISHQSRFLG